MVQHLRGYSFFALWPPGVVLTLALVAATYIILAGRGSRTPATRQQFISFFAGLGALWVGLGTPLHIIGEVYLMTAHMTTTMLVMMVAAPLMIAGIPGSLISRMMQSRWGHVALRLVSSPLLAFGLFNVVFMGWHVPVLFNIALQNDAVHILQYVTLVLSALVGWLPLVGNTPEPYRLSDPMKMAYTFGTIVLQTVLFGPMMIVDRPIYAVYALAPRITGLSALEDQQLGHLFMGVLSPLVLGLIFTSAFFRMVRSDERRV